MRDPQGELEFVGDEVVRRLHHALEPDHFLKTATARALVDDGRLVDFAFRDELTIVSPRIPFVSHPTEWSNMQLADAANLTLDLARRAYGEKVELKDASAWNVVFDGTRPLFCDHLSFQSITGRSWWAFAQFVRHFVLPLVVKRHRGLNINKAFKFSRDGLHPTYARNLLGLRRFLTRYWPFMFEKDVETDAIRSGGEGSGATYHQNLFALLDWLLAGVRPHTGPSSNWSSYTDTREHYSDDALRRKHEVLGAWLERIAPRWVIDYGCNTGEYSVLAASKGARVVSIDLDHDSIEQLYASCRGRADIFPVIANLDDLSGGRGWAGEEFPGLMARLEAVGEVGMMLALVHHLTISSSIPIERVAALARRTSRNWLIVELIEETDPLVLKLCAQRNRDPSEFSLAKQKQAFEKYFTQADEVSLAGTGRHLLLLEARRD